MRSALLLAAIGLSLAGRGSAPTQMHLVFDGRHNASFLHQGTFVNSASWCPSGTAVDESVDASTDTAVRRFTCLGGGEFTAKIQPLPAEHGGSGSWQIVGGTGALADLRGKGTFTSVRLSGSSDDPASITFRSTWDGVAGFDATPPAVAVASANARVINRAQRLYRLRLSLRVTDGQRRRFVRPSGCRSEEADGDPRLQARQDGARHRDRERSHQGVERCTGAASHARRDRRGRKPGVDREGHAAEVTDGRPTSTGAAVR